MAFYPNAEIIEDDDFLGFSVSDFTITLEPAAQMEISISPKAELQEIGEIYQAFRRNLDVVLKEFEYVAVNMGCQPVSCVADLEMIPKKRYKLMDEYFWNIGSGGMEMMRGTASLQISIDYHSEIDFRKKIQAAYYYSPILKLFSDHSSSFQGKTLRTNLKRTDIWRRVDPVRCGILPNIFSETYSFKDYADFIGKIPPIFLKNGKQFISTGCRTANELFAGKKANEDEVVHLLSMSFPDVRLKQVLEIRFADSLPFSLMMGYCALVKGLLYSDEGLTYAKTQIIKNRLSEENILEAENEIIKHGWQAFVYGQAITESAKQCLQMARRNLSDTEGSYLRELLKITNVIFRSS